MRPTARSATRGLLTVIVAITSIVATTSIAEAAAPPTGTAVTAPVARAATRGDGPIQRFSTAQLDALQPGASAVLTHENIVEALEQLEATVPHRPASDSV